MRRKRIICPLLGLLLLTGCMPVTASLRPDDPNREKPSYLKQRIAAAPQETDREILEKALALEQIYVDMLADFTLGRFGNGFAGGGALMAIIRPYLGAPYRWGVTQRQGLDCSGFTLRVFSKLGIRLPHNSAAQARYGTPVARTQLRAGDLVFFAVEGGQIDHVGVMVNKHSLAHCSRSRGRCTIEPLARTFPGSFAGARRLSLAGRTAKN